MALQCGIVGLPNVGKSTIFNALTASEIPAENYPFCTIDPNVGIVEVPDVRLEQISAFINPAKITPATVEFVDIAGLVKGASKGEGLGNQFLSHIRNVSAIVHVIRCFNDDNVTHVEGSINPVRDAEIIEMELLLRDLDSVEKRRVKVRKSVRIGDKDSRKELDALEHIIPYMNEGKMVRNIPLEPEMTENLRHMFLLTQKPILYVANVDESEIQSMTRSEPVQRLFDFAENEGNTAVRLCGNIEAEIAQLDGDDRQLFMEEYHLAEPGLDKLIHSAYRLLGLETFFTAGDKEVRAWTIPKGYSAPMAAGEIHTDFQRGFIKAEIYHFTDLMQYHSEMALKESGKIRQEGKSYIVKDGDVIFFKFNV